MVGSLSATLNLFLIHINQKSSKRDKSDSCWCLLCTEFSTFGLLFLIKFYGYACPEGCGGLPSPGALGFEVKFSQRLPLGKWEVGLCVWAVGRLIVTFAFFGVQGGGWGQGLVQLVEA